MFLFIHIGMVQAGPEVVYEPFDYEEVDLNGQSGGTGFDSAWTVTASVSNPY